MPRITRLKRHCFPVFAICINLTSTYLGYESLAQDADVEVVYVGAIHPSHLEICKMMLNAGKHLLCEKVRLKYKA